MSDIELKRKMISLRLSDADYAVLKSQYRAHGARNVSDLARLALHRLVQTTASSQDEIALRLTDLEDRVHTLEAEMSLILDHKAPS